MLVSNSYLRTGFFFCVFGLFIFCPNIQCHSLCCDQEFYFILGYLYVQDQHYAFYFSGAAMFISGFISLPLRRISQWERKKRGEMANSTSSDEEMKHQAFIRPVELVGI